MEPSDEFVVPLELRRGVHRSDQEWLPGALELLDLLASAFGRADLATASVLDVGCGTKLAAAIVNRSVPIGRYVGVDTDAEVTSFLAERLDDPRMSFHHLDAHNELYNSGGRPLASYERLPGVEGQFDIVCLFSVFTHLAPHDYTAMLELLRAHVTPEGGLLFSLFVNERTEQVAGEFRREFLRRWEAGDPEIVSALNQEVRRRRQAGLPDVPDEAGSGVTDDSTIPDFIDRVPEQPLLEAAYSESYARRLIEGTGWEVVELRPPVRRLIQHHFICRPV